MFNKKMFRNRSMYLLFVAVFLPATNLFAYSGNETFLHYVKAPENLLSHYQSVCKSIVLSDANSDTLKNAKTELDLAMPKILGGAALPVADGEGAIILAEQGSAPVSSAGIDYSKVENEGFIIKSSGGKTYISGKNQVGVLRGTFFFLRLMQMGKNIDKLDTLENPYFSYRVLDHWYNHYNSSYEADRLYGGSRVFKMENFGNLGSAGAERTRVIDYCRMAAALGLNGITPDCVNTYQSGSNGNHKCLEESNLKTQKIFADIIGTYGLKYYLSVSYASPRLVSPKMSSADAYKNAQAKQWWVDKVDVVRSYIKNFGGFLMKADSEGEEGPRSTYGETQSQGANPIAEALGRYGHIMVWRTFIYGTSDPDFAVNQGKEFAKPAQTWNEAVVVRMKDGTHDFQVIEPPHQLLAMSGVRLGMEFQITQEYTGQGIHLCWLVPRWKKVLDWDIKGSPAPGWSGAPGTITHQILKGAGKKTGGVWAISNLSDTVNWTANFLHQANYYGWGRLAWNPTISADQIADEWIRCSFDNGNDPNVQHVVKHMLMRSWPAYSNYVIWHNASMPQIGNNQHYEVDFANMKNINFFNEWLMNFISNGIGVARCNGSGGTVRNNFARDYLPSALANIFCDANDCPEEYMLFFHHYEWGHKMKGGMTLIQQLQWEHYNGIHQVQKWIKYWKLLNNSNFHSQLVDAEIHNHVLSKLNHQLKDGSRWTDNFRRDFGRYYSTQVPCHLDLITPDTTKAVEVAVDAEVNLSARMRMQNGTDASGGTFNWSVVEPGAKLSAATGTSTVFRASAPGIYTVKVCDSRWPNQFEDELIFVDALVGANNIAKRAEPVSLKIFQAPQCIVISASVAGEIDIYGLNGRIVKSVSLTKPGTCFWDTRSVAGGLYLIRLATPTGNLQSKLIVK